MADHPPCVIGTYSIPVEKDAEGFPLCRQSKTDRSRKDRKLAARRAEARRAG